MTTNRSKNDGSAFVGLSRTYQAAAKAALAPDTYRFQIGDDSVAPAMIMNSVSVTLAGARAAIDAAIEEAARIGKKLTVAVVDASGELIALHRMDGAVTVSIDSAIIKAKTVVRTGVASSVLEDMLNSGNLSVMLMPGTTAMGGGVPIVHDHAIVGGIAASGDTVETDERACQAGIAALLRELQA